MRAENRDIREMQRDLHEKEKKQTDQKGGTLSAKEEPIFRKGDEGTVHEMNCKLIFSLKK